MPRHPKIRLWQLLATLLAILAVLLTPHLPNHAPALFLFVPLFFFLERIDRLVSYQPRKRHVIATSNHIWRADPRLPTLSHKGRSMDLDLIFNGAFLASFILFAAVFLLRRLQYRRKKTANPGYRGFYPTAAALSLALLSLHTLAQPDLHHVLEQRQTEAEPEDDDNDPEDPTAQLNHQLKRIRNGERVDRLRVPLQAGEKSKR